MRLVSDFHDYYDHHMDGSYAETPLLERFAAPRGGCRFSARRRDHDWVSLATCGFRVVPHGTVDSFSQLDPRTKIVVYTDPLAHRGEGKYVLTVGDAMAMEARDSLLASLYLPPLKDRAVSVRLLRLGHLKAVLRYTGPVGGWRSNHAREDEDVLIESLPEVEADPSAFLWMISLQESLDHPLVAVDLVDGYAVDLNTAPGIPQVLRDVWKPSEVAGAFSRWSSERSVRFQR